MEAQALEEMDRIEKLLGIPPEEYLEYIRELNALFLFDTQK